MVINYSELFCALPLLTATCTSGSVRLVGSSGQQGTVEVCLNNNWGTVCDGGWSTADANIVCRQLGYSNAGIHHGFEFTYICLILFFKLNEKNNIVITDQNNNYNNITHIIGHYGCYNSYRLSIEQRIMK